MIYGFLLLIHTIFSLGSQKEFHAIAISHLQEQQLKRGMNANKKATEQFFMIIFHSFFVDHKTKGNKKIQDECQNFKEGSARIVQGKAS